VNQMPVISRFYGILIRVYFKEHGVPHFHAMYGEHHGIFNIKTLEMIEGDLPARAMKLVENWARKYDNELMEMWRTQRYRRLPGLE